MKYQYYMKPDYSIQLVRGYGHKKLAMKEEIKEPPHKISITQLKKSEMHGNNQHLGDFRRL